MELKVQSERVVAAAAKCADVDKVLRELFPEAFPPPKLAGGTRISAYSTGVEYIVVGKYLHKLLNETYGYGTTDQVQNIRAFNPTNGETICLSRSHVKVVS